MSKTMQILFVLFFIFYNLCGALAEEFNGVSASEAKGDYTVTVTATPKEIYKGDIFTVAVNIMNLSDKEVTFYAKVIATPEEAVDGGVIFPESDLNIIAALPPYLEFKGKVPPKNNTGFSYRKKAIQLNRYYVEMPDITICSSQNPEGYIQLAPFLNLSIRCVPNNSCEPKDGENYDTCPEDCPPCGADDYCNLDCPPGADPDCIFE